MNKCFLCKRFHTLDTLIKDYSKAEAENRVLKARVKVLEKMLDIGEPTKTELEDFEAEGRSVCYEENCS